MELCSRLSLFHREMAKVNLCYYPLRITAFSLFASSFSLRFAFRIEMLNETFMNRLACSVFDLQKLKNSENRRFTGQLEVTFHMTRFS